ncbi:copper-binding protein [Morganella morganii]|uniref:copper-binding protein n=1 Tax=Morganella morganii TaxID=582 RepID=UPI0021A73B8F|nr:copper-binding protein [Morganella morganii]
MLKQRRQGYLLLFFTLFFILLCLTQRMSGAPRISLSPSADFTTPMQLSDTETGSANPGSTCDISAKSLSTVPQFPAEPLFFALLFFVMTAVIVPVRYRSRSWRQHIPPMRLRRHLHFCVMRD